MIENMTGWVSDVTHWNAFWENPDPRVHYQSYNPYIVSGLSIALGSLAGKRILETGCGTAVDSIELSARGAYVIALDYSSAALVTARQKATNNIGRLSWIQGDILAVPTPSRSFDAVFHAGVLEHFREPLQVLREQHRVLNRNGILLVDVPQKYNLYTIYKARLIRAGTWFAGWETQYSIRELKSLVERAGFSVLHTYGHGYFPPMAAKLRWASSIGKGIIGRPFMPYSVAKAYEQCWQRFEESSAFTYVAQNVGIVCRKQ